MICYEGKKTSLCQFENFIKGHGTRHFISTTKGGVSEGAFKGLNLGFGTDDNPQHVLANREILSEELGIPLDWFVFPRQTHSTNIRLVTNDDKGKGVYDRESAIPDTDALITNIRNIFLVVQVADCVPVLLYDPVTHAAAAIHAGWKGTLGNIVTKTIAAMANNFGTQVSDLLAGIGPSNGPCCYEVGEDLYTAFVTESPGNSNIFTPFGEKFKLDLWKANQYQLLQAGVKQENIEIAGICTQCHPDIFYSSRVGKGNTGRFTAGIMLV